VTTAKTAISALPVGYQTLAETLQATVDTLVASNEEYTIKVATVLSAYADKDALKMEMALIAAGVIRIDDNNIDKYEFDMIEPGTVADLQVLVDLTNAYIYIGNDGAALTDKEKINYAQELVNFIPEDIEIYFIKAGLQAIIDNAQTTLTAVNEVAV